MLKQTMTRKGVFSVLAILFVTTPAYAILGRWIEPERNRAENAIEGAAFLEQIGALGALTFYVKSVDRVDVAAGIKSSTQVVVNLTIESIGNAHFRVLSIDPSIKRPERQAEFHVEEFSPEAGRVMLGEWIPGYDSRHKIYVSSRQHEGKLGFQIQMVRTIEERGYLSEFIPSPIQTPARPVQLAVAELMKFLEVNVQPVPIRESTVRSKTRTANVRRAGSIELVDSATHRIIRTIEPLLAEHRPHAYFEDSNLVVEYETINLRLLFASQDGQYLRTEALRDFSRLNRASCQILFGQ